MKVALPRVGDDARLDQFFWELAFSPCWPSPFSPLCLGVFGLCLGREGLPDGFWKEEGLLSATRAMKLHFMKGHL